MQMKTFRAASMAEAVRSIREEMGPSAVLVATRRLQGGAVDVTAAVEGPAAGPPPAAEDPPKTQAPPASSALRPAGQRAERFALVRRQLERSGLDADLISDVLARVDEVVPGGAGVAVLRREVRAELASRIRATDGLVPRTGPVVAMLVGPTGVGKTTSIAKVAADAALRQRKRVGLLTLDTYRIGAVDQLRIYAEILDAPFAACGDPAALRQALAHMAALDLVLIDTAGRNPFARGEVEALAPFLEAAPEVEVHLTVAAPTRTAELLRIHDRHACLHPRAMVFTKLDESGEFGGLVSVAVRTRTPVSFLCAGQRVPEDLEPARPARLAAAVLDPNLFETPRGGVVAAA